MLKAAIIGNGYISGSHRAAYEQLEKEGANVKLVAICDIREEKLKDNYGQHLYTDIDEMLDNEDIDFVSVCVPTYLHKEVSVKCMKKGIDVLCEKPMALQYDDCLEMLKVSEETGKRLMIAQVARFGRDVRVIKEIIASGEMGGLVSAFFQTGDDKPTWGYNDWFKDDALSGGCMLDLQAHNIDLINWFFGMPEFTSVTAKKCAEDYSGFGSISANMVYENGAFIHSWCDWGIPKNQHDKRYIRINLEKGYVLSNRMGTKEFVKIDYATGKATDLSDSHPEWAGSGHYNEIKYYLDCLENNKPFDLCPPEESAKVLKIMRSQERSAQKKGAPDKVI